jgi:hypothetical protein
VGPDGAGGFVVVWSSNGSSGTDTDSTSVQGQRYDSAGTAVGGEFQVNTYTTGLALTSAVSPDGAGGFVVVWENFIRLSEYTIDYMIVQGQRYDSAGTAVGGEFQVNTYTALGQVFSYGPAVSPDGAGGFVVVWSSAGSSGTDTSGNSVQGQRFSGAIPSTTTSTTLPPPIPTISGSVHLLLTALLAVAMLVLGLAWRLNWRAG